MKKVLIIIGAVVLALAIAGGSFYGGMAYQNNQQAQTRANFLRSRGITDNGAGGNGGFTGAGQGGGQGGRGFGGGTTGQVKSLNGSTLMVSTAQNVTTVNLTASTIIEKSVPGATTDLQPGERVIVTGQRDSNGVVTASQVLIVPQVATPAGAAAGTAVTPTP
ncbi:MAG TPA: DUF5666 domain-containing protein [Anaerolineales bacterium]